MTKTLRKMMKQDLTFWNYELEIPIPKEKNQKVIGFIKNELGGKIIVPRAKTYSYLIDDDSEDEKAKGTKNCVIKRKFKFEIIKTA